MKTYNSHEYIRNRAMSIVPSFRYDKKEDFSKWREKAKEKLAELLMLPNERCEDEFKIISKKSFDGYKRIDFEFQSEPGYFVSSSFLIPVDCTGKIPTVICIQGHSTGMHISLGEAIYDGDKELIAGGRDFALRTVAEGFCAVTIEQRYMGSAGHNKEGQPACLSNNEGMATLLLGRTAIGERVWDISRLIDVIIKHFSEYVDTDKIVCLGNSGGGTATFYASCFDERIFLSVPSCSVCTFEDSIMAMWHCPCNFIPGIRKYFDMGDLGCLIAPRKLVVVCGTRDDIFPVDGVEKSYDIIKSVYDHIGKSENCKLVKGNGGHQFYPDDIWPIIHEYLK